MNARKLKFGPFILDLEQKSLLQEGKRVPIRPQALQTLIFLAENRKRIVSRNELYSVLWPGNNVGEDQSLNVVIKNLREVLNDDPKNPLYVETIPRRGYQFVGTILEEPVTLKKTNPVSGVFPYLAIALIILFTALTIPKVFTDNEAANPIVTRDDISVTARTQLVLGEQKIREGKFEEGRKIFQEIVSDYPEFSEGYYWLARTWSLIPGLRLEAAGKAKEYYLKAIEKNPGYVDALIDLGTMYLVTDLNASKAEELANKAILVNQRNPRSYMLLGFVSLSRGQPGEAIKVFDRVSAIDPTLMHMTARVGWTYYMAGRFDDAARLCTVLIESLDENGWARDCLFETYLAMGKEDLAKKQAAESLKDSGLGELEIQQILGGDSPQWLKNFDLWQLQFFNNLDYPAHYNKAFVELRLGNLDKAFKDLEEVVRQRHYPYFVTLKSDPRLAVFLEHPEAESIFLDFQ